METVKSFKDTKLEEADNNENKDKSSDKTYPPEKGIEITNDDDNQLDNVEQIEVIDIDEFLLRSNECGRCQVWIVVQMMLVTFTLAYTPFIFYFIGYDPHWTNLDSGDVHLREDNARCFMNDTQWEFDYSKTTLVTEVSS